MARKLAANINQEFPEIFEDEAREAVATMLFNLHFQSEIGRNLYADQYDAMDARLEQRRIAKINGDDLI